jgi:calcineurin-like phosphoesterase family protein
MREFVTSDEHYGHANIIKFSNRPFKDTDEMTRVIIEKHNAKVPRGPGSLTIHLGDMFWRTLPIGECMNIVSCLHGVHAYVWGNHEENMRNELLRSMFISAEHIKVINWNKHKIVLCHYAMRVWDKSHTGSWMLYGHSHGELSEQGLSFDVGVDSHNFEPWSMEEIEAKMATLKQNHVIPADKVFSFTELGQQQAQ